MYKEASRLKIRYQTSRGLITVEQLWDLNINDLDALAILLEKEYKASGKKSFVVKTTKKNKLIKLMFDIVLDVLTTKVDEEDVKTSKYAKDIFNAKIDERIAKKQESDLDDLSIEELEKMRK